MQDITTNQEILNKQQVQLSNNQAALGDRLEMLQGESALQPQLALQPRANDNIVVNEAGVLIYQGHGQAHSLSGKPVTPQKVKDTLTIDRIKDIKNLSRSRKNFVKHLFFSVYGDDILDCTVYATLKKRPGQRGDRLCSTETPSSAWQECVNATNRGISDSNKK